MQINNQLAALQRIAKFSAQVRGHELGEWQTGQGFAQANCTRCGRPMRVYLSLFQPEVEGAAIESSCRTGEVQRAA